MYCFRNILLSRSPTVGSLKFGLGFGNIFLMRFFIVGTMGFESCSTNSWTKNSCSTPNGRLYNYVLRTTLGIIRHNYNGKFSQVQIFAIWLHSPQQKFSCVLIFPFQCQETAPTNSFDAKYRCMELFPSFNFRVNCQPSKNVKFYTSRKFPDMRYLMEMNGLVCNMCLKSMFRNSSGSVQGTLHSQRTL